MQKKNIYVIEFSQLFNILYEINNYLNYNLYSIEYKSLLKQNDLDFKNSLFLFKNSSLIEKKTLNIKNSLIIDNLPLQIKELTQKINIFFLQNIYQLNSQINFKSYNLNINNKIIKSNNRELKLTEKEVKIILFLLSKKTPQKVSILQHEIWGYNKNSETHTVETHIYRLRKKINTYFNDTDFLKKNKIGYQI